MSDLLIYIHAGIISDESRRQSKQKRDTREDLRHDAYRSSVMTERTFAISRVCEDIVYVRIGGNKAVKLVCSMNTGACLSGRMECKTTTELGHSRPIIDKRKYDD